MAAQLERDGLFAAVFSRSVPPSSQPAMTSRAGRPRHPGGPFGQPRTVPSPCPGSDNLTQTLVPNEIGAYDRRAWRRYPTGVRYRGLPRHGVAGGSRTDKQSDLTACRGRELIVALDSRHGNAVPGHVRGRRGSRVPDFPRTYRVVREGQVVPVTVDGFEPLVTLRTELAILAAFGRGASEPMVDALTARLERVASDQALENLTHTVEDMRTVLRDAMHPLTAAAIAVIDREFPQARGEIVMSSIERESREFHEDVAEQIARSGADDADALSEAFAAADQETPSKPAQPSSGDPDPKQEDDPVETLLNDADPFNDQATGKELVDEMLSAAPEEGNDGDMAADLLDAALDTSADGANSDEVNSEEIEAALTETAELLAEDADESEGQVADSDEATDVAGEPDTAALLDGLPETDQTPEEVNADEAEASQAEPTQHTEIVDSNEEHEDLSPSDEAETVTAELERVTRELDEMNESIDETIRPVESSSDAPVAEELPTGEETDDTFPAEAGEGRGADEPAESTASAFDEEPEPPAAHEEIASEESERAVSQAKQDESFAAHADLRGQIEEIKKGLTGSLDRVAHLLDHVEQVHQETQEKLVKATQFQRAAEQAHEASEQFALAQTDAIEARATFEVAQQRLEQAREVWENARRQAAEAARRADQSSLYIGPG